MYTISQIIEYFEFSPSTSAQVRDSDDRRRRSWRSGFLRRIALLQQFSFSRSPRRWRWWSICLVLFLSGPATGALSLLRSWANNRMMIQPTEYRALWSSRVACPWGLLGRAVGVCICSIWNKLQLRLGARTKSLVPPAEYERMRKCLCACVWTCASFLLLLLLLFGLC